MTENNPIMNVIKDPKYALAFSAGIIGAVKKSSSEDMDLVSEITADLFRTLGKYEGLASTKQVWVALGYCVSVHIGKHLSEMDEEELKELDENVVEICRDVLEERRPWRNY